MITKTKRGSVTEHSALQKDSTQYTLDTGDFGHLLSSVHCNGSYRGSRRDKSIHLRRLDFSRDPGVSEFYLKPNSLLLKDERGEPTS